MSEEEANKENTESQASEEEQSGKERSEIGSPEEGISRFFEKKAREESSEEAEEVPEDKEEEPCEECQATDEDLKVEDEEPKLWILDGEGKKTPFVFKADGKTYTPDDPEWVMKQANLGVHSNVKTEEANKKLSQYEQIKPFFDFLDKACKDGRLMVDGKRVDPMSVDTGESREEKGEEEETDETRDPEIVKLEKEVKSLKEMKLKEVVQEYKGKMLDAFDKVRPDNYFANTRMFEDPEDVLYPMKVWDILQKNPKLAPEEAMEKSHQSHMRFFFDEKTIKSLIEKNPEKALLFLEKVADNPPDGFDKFKNRIITDYLDGKGKKEVAPVGAPSGAIQGKTEPEERKFKDVDDAVHQWEEHKKAKEAAGRKS